VAINADTLAAMRAVLASEGMLPNTLVVSQEIAHALGLDECQDEDGSRLVWSDEAHEFVDPTTGKPRT